MIDSWRTVWKQGDFPFYFVQLANFKDPKDQPADSDWAELREAQTMTLKRLANTGMAVIIDIGEAKDIHPKNKQDVGKRLALWALANDYGKRLVHSGPLFKSMTVHGSKARIAFDHVGSGLMTPEGQPIQGFAVAGLDRTWHWAQAKIVGNVVEVSSDKVTQPLAVRYGWADNPPCNLYNKEGLPASPFRTDNWPMITAGKKF
jgi:sialate O-acetylesterase